MALSTWYNQTLMVAMGPPRPTEHQKGAAIDVTASGPSANGNVSTQSQGTLNISLLALYERFRPWDEGDTYTVTMILMLLFLLVIFNRYKSFLANGCFVGCLLGCLCAMVSNGTYGNKMSYVELGILLGLLLGGLAKKMFPFVQKPLQDKSEQSLPKPESSNVSSPGPAFWVSALALSGISVGLTLALFFQMTYAHWFLLTMGLFLTGCVLGIAIGSISNKKAWVLASLELVISIALTTGIGAIIGWRFVFPFLIFDVNPDYSTEDLFRVAIISCAATGSLIGLIAWAVITLRRKPALLPLAPMQPKGGF
jgi:hypothetical protein